MTEFKTRKTGSDKQKGKKFALEEEGDRKDIPFSADSNLARSPSEDDLMDFAKEKSEEVQVEQNETETEGLGLPEYQSDEWNKLKDHVANSFPNDFNEVPLENLQRVDENYFENIRTFEVTDSELKDYFGGELPDDEDEIEEARDELQMEQNEIMWGTLFEAKSEFVVDKIMEHDEKLHKLGLRIIDERGSDAEDAYQTGVFIGVNSAGHDFYEAYWVPMWKIFGWLPNR